jgi:hypothetical protein
LCATPKKRSDTNFSFDLKRQKNKYPTTQSKSLAALPCKLRCTAKHLLSCHRTCFVDKFLQLDKNLNTDLLTLAQ